MSGHTERFDPNDYDLNPESPYGVYIMHGFTSSTYEVRGLAQYLAKQGFHAVAENLPGHGTTVEECNRVRYTDWLSHVEQGVAKLMAESEKVFVAGESMGAVLAIHAADVFPLDGLILAAPLMEFNHPIKTRFLNPFMCHLVPYLDKRQFYPKKTYKFYGYTRYPMKALNQLVKLTNMVRRKLHRIKAPVLIQYTTSDITVPVRNAQIIRENISSTLVQFSDYSRANHNMWDDDTEKDAIYNEVLDFLNKRVESS